MKIKLGAQVVANDSAVLGNVDRLVIDPEKRALVALIVHRGRFLTEDRIVERTLIDDVGEDGIVRLSLASHDAEALPRFIKAEYVTPSVEMDSVLYPRSGSGFMAGGGQIPGLGVSSSFSATTPTYGSAGPHGGGFAGAPGGLVGTSQYGSMNFEVRSNLPSEVVVFEHKAEVVDANGKKIGNVEEIMEDDTGAITGLRLRGGLFGRHHAYVPTEAVAGASAKRVRLSIPAEAVVYADPDASTNQP
jgi:uncharacterized protein YrrD